MNAILRNALLLLTAGLLASNVAVAGKEIVPEFVDGTVRVSAEEVIGLVEELPNLVIIDSRKSSDHRKGFIEGSVAMPNTETDAKSLRKHASSKSTPLLFYCNGIRCGRSVKAAKIAMANGYKKIYWFRGGVEEWEAKGLPLVRP